MRDDAQRRIACQLIVALIAVAGTCVLIGAGVVYLRDWSLLTDAGRRHGVGIPRLWKADGLQIAMESVTAVWFVLLGGSLGSFLNVVVYRLPLGMTLLGSSHCPHCRATIRARDNIPVWGWIARGGRCFHCWLPIDPRYPRLELAMAVGLLILATGEIALQGANWTGQLDSSRAGFCRTLFEWDRVPCVRFTVHAMLLFALLATQQMEDDGHHPSSALWGLVMLVTFILFAAVPGASPAYWSNASLEGGATVSWCVAWSNAVAGSLLGLGWGLALRSGDRVTNTSIGELFVPTAIGTTFGWKVGLIVFLLAGVLTIGWINGDPRTRKGYSSMPAHTYLIACIVVWFGWSTWPLLLRSII